MPLRSLLEQRGRIVQEFFLATLMDAAWYRGPQRSPRPSRDLRTLFDRPVFKVEKPRTRINQIVGKLIRVSIGFAYQ